jgi:hypothetical protein
MFPFLPFPPFLDNTIPVFEIAGISPMPVAERQLFSGFSTYSPVTCFLVLNPGIGIVKPAAKQASFEHTFSPFFWNWLTSSVKDVILNIGRQVL